MKLDVDGTQLEALLHSAIVESLGDKGREAIIREAVAHLTTAPASSSGYDRDKRPSPLMSSLHAAARAVAEKHIATKLTEDKAFIEQVEALYVDAARRMFDVENREKLATKLATAMGNAISQDRY